MPQMVTGRKYSAKTRCFTAVIFDPVTEIMSSLPRCNHQTISEIWSKCTMRRLARGATVYKLTTELCVCNCFSHFIWFIAPEKIIIEKSGWGYNIYLLLKLNFLLLENPLKSSFCTYNQHQSIIKKIFGLLKVNLSLCG